MVKNPKYFKETNKENQVLWVIIAILALALLAIIFLLSFGRANFFEQERSAEEERKEKENRKLWLEHRKSRLEKLILKKKGLQNSLDRIVKISQWCLRIFMLGLVAMFNIIIYKYSKDPSVGDFASWNGIAAIIISILFFIFGPKGKNLSTLRDQLELQLKIRIYGDYLGIHEDLENKEKEVEAIVLEITTLDQGIKKT